MAQSTTQSTATQSVAFLASSKAIAVQAVAAAKMRANVGFERLRRITGYLVGSLERWNDGKKAEEAARVKHNVSVGQYDLKTKAKREQKKACAKAALGKE